LIPAGRAVDEQNARVRSGIFLPFFRLSDGAAGFEPFHWQSEFRFAEAASGPVGARTLVVFGIIFPSDFDDLFYFRRDRGESRIVKPRAGALEKFAFLQLHARHAGANFGFGHKTSQTNRARNDPQIDRCSSYLILKISL
jgi:hypothetical protein